MRKLTIAVIVTGAGILTSGPSPNASSSLSEDLDLIMSWWAGDYDNSAQIAELRRKGAAVWAADDSGEGGHIEVTSHYRPVQLPAFGENVIYVEETKHGDPSAMFRQRIYTLSVDNSLGAIRVKLWNFKDKEKYVGAFQNLDSIAGLTPDEMSPLPDNCDLIVERQDDKFHMPMRDRLCAFGDRYFNYQVLLGENSFWFRDKIVRLSDDVVLQAAGDFTYHELERLQ
ncbi:MAG: chromophore lyase CpcT/CpeT [Pseudomonadota bacterium]